MTLHGKGEELRLQSQEGQELSAAAGANQLILKITSDHQTVDHTNKIMGNASVLQREAQPADGTFMKRETQSMPAIIENLAIRAWT
jgi:hypothetical protein